MKIKFEGMVNQLAKDGELIKEQLTPESAHLWHMATGLSTEAGEVLSCMEYFGSDRFDRVNAVEEFGDVEFYLEGLRQGLNIVYKLPHEREYSPLRPAKCLARTLAIVASDVLDSIKKVVIYQKPVEDTKIFPQLWELNVVLARLYHMTEITREEVIEANIAKLGVRYKCHNYSDNAAQVRADKVGE